jgi:hypothetical protein
MGLYITWLEKERIAQKTNDLKYQLLHLKDRVDSELNSTKQKYKKVLEKNKELEEKIELQEKEIETIQINQEEKQQIQLVVPSENNFSGLIKKEKDIVSNKLLLQEEKEKENEIKLLPEVLIDKETKEIESIKVNVETKF